MIINASLKIRGHPSPPARRLLEVRLRLYRTRHDRKPGTSLVRVDPIQKVPLSLPYLPDGNADKNRKSPDRSGKAIQSAIKLSQEIHCEPAIRVACGARGAGFAGEGTNAEKLSRKGKFGESYPEPPCCHTQTQGAGIGL